MKMPNVTVSFKETGITAIQRSKRGIVLLILEEENEIAPLTVYSVDDIPETLTDKNKEQIKLALMGYINAPRYVLVYFIHPAAVDAEQDYTEILRKIERVKFNYLVVPNIADKKTDDIASWVKSMRTTKDIDVKAVLPNTAADCEGVINFTNTLLKTKDKSYTTAEYCSRVAGIICGTPATISCTYAPAAELCM